MIPWEKRLQQEDGQDAYVCYVLPVWEELLGLQADRGGETGVTVLSCPVLTDPWCWEF